MSAVDRARSALDAIRDGEHEQSDAERRVAAFVEEWRRLPGAVGVISRARYAGTLNRELTVGDLTALLGMIDELRRFPPIVLTGQLPVRRRGDRSTSVAAGERPSRVRRAGSQSLKILRAYGLTDELADRTPDAHPAEHGLTDGEARVAAGISARACYWKRCSELRAEGLIEPVTMPAEDADRVVTRPAGKGERVIARVAAGTRDVTRPDPDTGEDRIVCRITDLGRRELSRVHS